MTKPDKLDLRSHDISREKIAQYALRGANTPFSISEYQFTHARPPRLQSALPTFEEIDVELGESDAGTAPGASFCVPKPCHKDTQILPKRRRRK